MTDSHIYFRFLVDNPVSLASSGALGDVVKAEGLVEIMRRAGISMTFNDAKSLLSMCAWPAFPLSPSNREDFFTASTMESLEVTVSSLQEWLCSLGSYRYVQAKMCVYLKAIEPTFCLHYLKNLKSKSSGVLSKVAFVRGFEESAVPLSRAESQALAELLVRKKIKPGRLASRRGPQSASKSSSYECWSWLRDVNDDVEESAGFNVEVDLLDGIANGDFLPAVL